MTKQYFQKKVSFVNFLVSVLVKKLKHNRKIVYALEVEKSLTKDSDSEVDNTIYRSAQIQSLVRTLYYDRNDPFNLKVLAALQKLVPEELRLLIEEGPAKEHSSTFIDHDDIPF
jgi:hypothetical protein